MARIIRNSSASGVPGVAAKVDKKQPHLLIAKSPTTSISRQLWQARISVSKDRKPSQSKNELQQIIKQISSIEFKPQDQTSEPLIVVEPIQKAEPNNILSDTEIAQEQQPNKIERKLPYEQVTEQTLQILKSYHSTLSNYIILLSWLRFYLIVIA